MKISEKDQQIIEDLKKYTALPIQDISKVFKALALIATMEYAEGKECYIPLLGKIHFKNNGDIFTEEGKEMDLSCFFIPHDYLKLNIGQAEDAKESGEWYKIHAVKQQIGLPIKRTFEDILEQ